MPACGGRHVPLSCAGVPNTEAIERMDCIGDTFWGVYGVHPCMWCCGCRGVDVAGDGAGEQGH